MSNRELTEKEMKTMEKLPFSKEKKEVIEEAWQEETPNKKASSLYLVIKFASYFVMIAILFASAFYPENPLSKLEGVAVVFFWFVNVIAFAVMTLGYYFSAFGDNIPFSFSLMNLFIKYKLKLTRDILLNVLIWFLLAVNNHVFLVIISVVLFLANVIVKLASKKYIEKSLSEVSNKK